MRNVIQALSLGLIVACASSEGQPSGAVAAAPAKGTRGEAPLLDLRLDGEEGAALVWLPAAGADGEHVRLLHVEGIETGLGANDVGLARRSCQT